MTILTFDTFKKQHKKMGIKLLRTTDVTSSQWGDCVTVSDKHSQWPITHDGRNLLPVLELDLSSLPFRLDVLEDIKIVQIFMDPIITSTPSKKPQLCDGRHILMRTFTQSDIVANKQLFKPHDHRTLVPQNYIIGQIIDDYPMQNNLYTADYFEDCFHREMTLDEEDDYNLNFFSKLGGWPHFIGDGVNLNGEFGDFVLQVDSDCGYEWGHDGTFFFFYKNTTREWFYFWESFPH